MTRYLFILFPLFLACSASQSGPKQPKIIGNWQWQQSSGGFAGKTTTPESSNQSRHLQITKDSIFSYLNGELSSAIAYQLKFGKVPLMATQEWFYDNESTMQVTVKRQDSLLILTENCADCFQYQYVKMKEK